MKMRNMTINFIMHRLLKYKILVQELATITVGMTAESAVTPTVIVALSAHHALCPAVIGLAACNAWARAKHLGCHSVITLAATGE